MTDNRTTELLPCPFCGGKATIEVKTEWYDYDGGDRWWIYQADVICYSCDAMMHVNHYKPKEFTDWSTAEQFAIEAWNTRVGRGECENVAPSYLDFLCSSCGFVHYHSDENDSGDGNEWNYCPNCGAKVVRDDGR